MGIQSNAALASLTVSKSLYDKDNLLKWICHNASPYQLKVTIDQKSPLKLETQGLVLTCRNTILRAICGTVLHGALDQYPHYLLGGSGNLKSTSFAHIIHWMSVGDTLRKDSNACTSLIADLDKHLETKSFLVGTAQPCLADYDLALSLNMKELDIQEFPAVQRWLATVTWSFQMNAPEGLTAPSPVSSVPSGPLTFYYGLEDISKVLKPLAVPKPKASAETKSDTKEPNNSGHKPQNDHKGSNDQQKNAKKQKKPGEGGNQVPASFDISALDIRVGKIVKAWHHEAADKLFCEEVDLGSEKRQIASGLRPFYKTEDLEGRMVLVLCNLKKRSLVGFPSHGMVLCASNADHSKVEFVVPTQGSKPGDRVVFEGFGEGDPEPENKVAKKKIFESLAPDLKTDANGVVIWKSAVAKTDVGVVKALNGMPNAQVA